MERVSSRRRNSGEIVFDCPAMKNRTVEAVPFEAVDISRISKSDAQTTLSKGTVDVNNSVDMLAWKHKKNDISDIILKFQKTISNIHIHYLIKLYYLDLYKINIWF